MKMYQRGNMGAGVIASISFAGILIAILIVAIASYISAVNYGVSAENRLKAEWENNEQILAQYSQKIGEAAQVPGMARDDLIKVFTGALGARYGAGGSQATMQWIKEQNPNLDAKMYIKLQQMIEAGRDEFKNAQTKLIDVKRQYENALGFFWQGMWLRIVGYPKIDLSKYKIITNDYANDAFKIGKEKGPMQLRSVENK